MHYKVINNLITLLSLWTWSFHFCLKSLRFSNSGFPVLSFEVRFSFSRQKTWFQLWEKFSLGFIALINWEIENSIETIRLSINRWQKPVRIGFAMSSWRNLIHSSSRPDTASDSLAASSRAFLLRTPFRAAGEGSESPATVARGAETSQV